MEIEQLKKEMAFELYELCAEKCIKGDDRNAICKLIFKWMDKVVKARLEFKGTTTTK